MENNIRQFRQRKITSSEQSEEIKEVSYFDYTFFLVFLFLIGFGLVMVYSASYYEGMIMNDGDAAYYLKKQALAVAIGFVGVFVTYKLPYQIYRGLGWIPYIASAVIILMIFPFGKEVNGARRWLEFGPIVFQAAEPVKLGMIIFLANLVYKYRKSINSIKTIGIFAAVTLPIVGMVYLFTNNLSSAIIIGAIAVAMVFVATKDYKWYVGIAIAGMASVAALVYAIVQKAERAAAEAAAAGATEESFRSNRILAWLDLEKYASDQGYQTLQSLYAIGSGGIWGKGLCQSIQKLNFLPEAQNDMIFSIICEELGLFGGILVILMFMILIWRMVIIATHAPDLHGAMIVVGVIAHIAVQVIFNIAVVTNTIPNTGISLPFISYGGTSICFLMCEIGIVMNVAKSIKIQQYR